MSSRKSHVDRQIILITTTRSGTNRLSLLAKAQRETSNFRAAVTLQQEIIEILKSVSVTHATCGTFHEYSGLPSQLKAGVGEDRLKTAEAQLYALTKEAVQKVGLAYALDEFVGTIVPNLSCWS